MERAVHSPESPTSAPNLDELLLRRGMQLLDEQREAMLAHDAERLSVANLRLGDWIHQMQRRSQTTHQQPLALTHDSAASLRRLGNALRTNAVTATGLRSHTDRALETLIPAAGVIYDEQGHASPSIPKRDAVSV